MRTGGGYAPRVLAGDDLPPIDAVALDGKVVAAACPAVMVGGFDLESLIEQDVWRRLLEGVAAEWVHAVFRPAWTPAEAESFREAVPPSRWPWCWRVADAGGWRALVAPDRPGRCFAVLRDADGVLLVVGKPTEEVWGRFAARLAPLRPDA